MNIYSPTYSPPFGRGFNRELTSVARFSIADRNRLSGDEVFRRGRAENLELDGRRRASRRRELPRCREIFVDKKETELLCNVRFVFFFFFLKKEKKKKGGEKVGAHLSTRVYFVLRGNQTRFLTRFSSCPCHLHPLLSNYHDPRDSDLKKYLVSLDIRSKSDPSSDRS